MKVNYKVVTFILAGVLIITYAWHWEDIFFHKTKNIQSQSDSAKVSGMKGIHQMPDGSMMMNDGSDMMDMTMNDMVDMMSGKTGKSLEKEFIVGMIPHHQGAVDMATVLLADPTVSRELKDFAQQIILAQTGEIQMMQKWLATY